jgi:hypothetical protein
MIFKLKFMHSHLLNAYYVPCQYPNNVRWKGPPLWSSGQSSWLQIQRFGFNFRRCQIFREVVVLERGPLSLVSTTEELLGRNNSFSGLEIREYGRGDPFHWSLDTLYPQKLTLTSPTSCGRSIGILRSWTNATEFFYVVKIPTIKHLSFPSEQHNIKPRVYHTLIAWIIPPCYLH